MMKLVHSAAPTPSCRSAATSKEAGGDPGSTASSALPEVGADGDEATYLELMKKAIKQRQKQQKLALLLGPNVPPLPARRVLT